MANTLATRKQSEAIRKQMQVIRSEMPYHVDDARARARELMDWKYHVQQHPWPIMAAAAVVGYLLVPAKKKEVKIAPKSWPQAIRDLPSLRVERHRKEQQESVAKPSMLGGLVAALAMAALRTGASVAFRQVSESFSGRGVRRSVAPEQFNQGAYVGGRPSVPR